MRSRFATYAWTVLVLNLAVIVWGAFVRASGSGAGCGEHWPLCNGQVLPTAPVNATVIEFAHRLTSGVAVISVVLLAIWAFRAFPKGYGVRRAALLTVLAIFIESAIGAGLVLLRLVGSNESFSRGVWLGAHLINTLFLLAALSMTAWQASNADRQTEEQVQLSPVALWISLVGFLIAGILGTFAALGDTLTVSTSVAAGLQADFSPLSNIFVRLRVLHPVVAGALGIGLLLLAFRAIASRPRATRLSIALASLVLVQFAVGFANIALKTPILIQLLHLLVADLLWVAFVLWACELRLGKGFWKRPAPGWGLVGLAPTPERVTSLEESPH